MASKPVALVDMDGTLCDFDSAMKAELRRVLGNNKVSDETKGQIRKLIERQTDWWMRLAPIPLGFSIVDALVEVGFRITILTKGPFNAPEAWSGKVMWCRTHLAKYKFDITITENKSLIYGRVLVDDWPKYAQEWLRHRPRGIVVMPGQKWNSDYSRERVYRVSDADEIQKIRPILERALVRKYWKD